MLGHIKKYLNLQSRKLFFNAYILPHLDYCSTIWGNCTKENLDRIINFLKKAVRLILDKDINAPSHELFQQLGWFHFDERVEYRKAVLVYKSLHSLAPGYLRRKFTYKQNSHNEILRSVSATTLNVPKPKLELFSKTRSYSGPKIWNSLPESVRSAPSLDTFKQRYIHWKKDRSLY